MGYRDIVKNTGDTSDDIASKVNKLNIQFTTWKKKSLKTFKYGFKILPYFKKVRNLKINKLGPKLSDKF